MCKRKFLQNEKNISISDGLGIRRRLVDYIYILYNYIYYIILYNLFKRYISLNK